eukprot:6188447-Pleurochrysis_carterae.AAC.1
MSGPHYRRVVKQGAQRRRSVGLAEKCKMQAGGGGETEKEGNGGAAICGRRANPRAQACYNVCIDSWVNLDEAKRWFNFVAHKCHGRRSASCTYGGSSERVVARSALVSVRWA